MSTPFTDNPRITLLRSLEDECANRYIAHAQHVAQLIAECQRLREERDRARNALRTLLEAYEADFNNAPEWPIRRSWETNRDPVNEAKEAIRDAFLRAEEKSRKAFYGLNEEFYGHSIGSTVYPDCKVNHHEVK